MFVTLEYALNTLNDNIQSHVCMCVSSSAKIIVKASKYDHVSQYLQELHWLPVNKRIMFKILMYVFKGLNGSGSRYLTSSLSVYTQSHYTLRSKMDAPRLSIPKFKSRGLVSAFNKSFSLTTPTMWNSLPSELRSAASLQSFKKGLKTHLYQI